MYFKDSLHVTVKLAGLLAGLIGMMTLFARALCGIAGDWAGSKLGLDGRVRLLGVTIFVEGLLMVLFSGLTILGPATATLLLFGLFVCMACGVTFAVVPLIRPRSVGSVSGIVGAGGNLGAVLAAMLFKSESLSGANAFLILGSIVAATSFSVFALRFPESKASASHVEAAPALMSADLWSPHKFFSQLEYFSGTSVSGNAGAMHQFR